MVAWVFLLVKHYRRELQNECKSKTQASFEQPVVVLMRALDAYHYMGMAQGGSACDS
jgi:hypothetical protein